MEYAGKQQTITKSSSQKSTGFFGKKSEPSFFAPAFIQPKLTVGPVDDIYEREADAVADKVMRMSDVDVSLQKSLPVSIQRKCAACEEEKVQMKGESSAGSEMTAPISVHNIVHSNGQKLDMGTRQFMELRFGYDFENVQIHNDSLAHISASEINALAYTQGNHVVFGSGQYQPNTNEGKQLLAHELTHVIQQKSASHGNIQRKTNCDGLMNFSFASFIPGMGNVAHTAIEADFISRGLTGTLITEGEKGIPAASAAPYRSQAICGGDSSIISPQKVGGKAGMGYPDLARVNGTNMEVVEIKPANPACFVDGEIQLANYIEKGNALEQKQWRQSKNIRKVVAMPEKTFTPASYNVGQVRMEVSWCMDGLIVYSLYNQLGPPPAPVPHPFPVENLAKIIAAGLAAKMLWEIGKQLGKKLNPATRAASMAAMVVLLASGKAEAKIGLDGEDPLEALFKSMEKDGIKVPDDVRKVIESDPELKKMLEEAAKGNSNLSEVQKKVAEKYSQYIYQHINEFSKDELRELLKATNNAAAALPSDMSVESIKQQLEERAKKVDKADAQEVDKAHPELPEDSKKLIKQASEPARKLFEAILKKRAKGNIQLSSDQYNTLVKDIFEIIPADLSVEKSDKLIALVQEIEKPDIPTILQHLKNNIKKLQTIEEQEFNKDISNADSREAEGDTAADSKYIETMKRYIEHYNGWDKLNFTKGWQINFYPDGKSAVIYITLKGVKYIAQLETRILDKKAGDAEVMSSKPIISENGETCSSIAKGTRIKKTDGNAGPEKWINGCK